MNTHISNTTRRGAPAGNLNAVKHGFYSSRFKKTERNALDSNEFPGLTQEIAMLRLFIRRVVQESAQIQDYILLLETLRVISLASSSLSHLAKTHTLLASSNNDVAEALSQAITEVLAEKRAEGRAIKSSVSTPLFLGDGLEQDEPFSLSG
jgi:hypothetical protein